MNDRCHIALAITGASGALYGTAICRGLLAAGCRVSLLVSRAGFLVLKEEVGLDWQGTPDEVNVLVRGYFCVSENDIRYFDQDDLMAEIASGSAAPDAMVVAPCSMGTLGRIAAGISGNLLERSADVMIKEGRPLLLVPRETPLSVIHLENMLKLARLGVRIIPAMPGFYGAPQTIDDLVNFIAGKLLDQLGVEHSLFQRWGE
jgi:4-hydroxy-3-polyprenylbenzoate decarboxylase